MKGMKLNLGCSDRVIDGFTGVDIAAPADIICDLAGPWPWEDSSADEVLAYDIVEHLPDRIRTMNELYRVLKAGARATIETPNAARGCGYYQDPTHRSPWCLSTFKYFEYGAFAHTRLAKSYGITAAFRIVLLEEQKTSGEFGARDLMGAIETAPPGVWIPAQGEVAWKIRAVLEAVK